MLTPKKWTLKSQITLMIGVMGSVSLICTILIVNLYSHQILKNQQIALQELVRQTIGTYQKKNGEMLREFGLRIQHNPEFKNAYKNRNIEKIKVLLNDEFSQYYITTRALVVNKIFVYDLNYELLTTSHRGDNYKLSGSICPNEIRQASKRTGNRRIKIIESLCYDRGHVFTSTILPIGSLKPKGYLQILSDPVLYIKKIENELTMPLKITGADNQVMYQTPGWSSLLSENNLLLKSYVRSDDQRRLFTVNMYRDINDIKTQSRSFRNLIIVSVIFVTVIAVIIFLFIFDKLLVKPLSTLTKQLSIIAEDKTQLGIELPLEGSQEIKHLTSRFNFMHNKLADLYHSLEQMAFTDELTELPNRSKLQEILSFHTSLNLRDETPFVLFMMDLDRFKSVNDTLGHHAGDLLLQEVSTRLSKVVRKSDYISFVTEQDSTLYNMDVIARLGGDEFATILPAMYKIEEAIIVAEKMLDVMKTPFFIEGNTLNVGVSIGIVICPLHGRSPQLLMQHADVAMYHAKNSQLGYMIYDAEIDKNRIDLLTLEDDLRSAIKHDELSLVYQPKINLQTNKIIGVEALLRWTHQEHGFIPPDRFIPVAEQSALINDVTHWVVAKALKQKNEWDKKNIPLSIAINISAKNLLCHSLLEFLQEQVSEYAIDAGSIYLEITETAVMADPVNSIIALRQLNEMGFRLSIDDFGTGYSSLSYLKKLPVHEIKIDRSFVMEMEKDANDAIIVQSTIDLAHNMGLSVTAEGVENATVLEVLRIKKSDFAQGYFMCRPVSNIDLEQWITESDWGLSSP